MQDVSFVHALADAGEPPRGILVDVRGQLDSLHQIQTSLGRGLLAAVGAIFLLLVAYFQSIRLALVSVAAIPETMETSVFRAIPTEQLLPGT